MCRKQKWRAGSAYHSKRQRLSVVTGRGQLRYRWTQGQVVGPAARTGEMAMQGVVQLVGWWCLGSQIPQRFLGDQAGAAVN